MLIKAINLEPNNINILLNLSECCHGLGETIDAKNYVLKVINIDPINSSAHKLLSTLIDYKNNDEYIKKMEELTNENTFQNYSSNQKAELLFGLSKAYEDIKDFKNSFKFLKQANLIENQNNFQKF